MSKMPVTRNHPNRSYNHSSLYSDLIETKTRLEHLRAEQPRVSFHFKAWHKHRKSTIDTVDSLQKKIDSVYVGCNAARGVGAAAGIVGVAAWVAGAILEMKGHKSAAQVIRTSQYCAGASTATMASSNLLEFGLTRSYMNEIERVIKKDVELTQSLKEWIQCSQKVESLFYRMFQCNIVSTTFSNIMGAFGCFIEALDAGRFEVEDLIRELQTCKSEDMEEAMLEAYRKVVGFLRKVQKNPKLIKPMAAIYRIFEEAPHVFGFAKSATDIYWMGFRMMNSGPLSAVLSLASVGCPDTGSVVMGCVLNAAAVTSHIVTFKNAVTNVQEGKSKYSESLDEIKTALNSELEAVNKKINDHYRRRCTNHENILELRNLKLS